MKRKIPALLVIALSLSVSSARALVIGVDNAHAFAPADSLGSGINFSSFRSTITGLGHTIVPLTSFDAPSLAGLDAVILNTPYNAASIYTPSQITAINGFTQRAVFLDDASCFINTSDYPISFGDNRKLLQNIVSYIAGGKGVLYIGEAGGGSDVVNMNALVATYGISYSGTPVDGGGLQVTNFVPHPLTAGITTVGVDFHRPMTITAPGFDLTVAGGSSNILATLIPEPTSAATIVASACLIRRRRHDAQSRALTSH